MTALQIAIAVIQSIMQLWAAAAYGVAFFRTGRPKYRSQAALQILTICTVLALMLVFNLTWAAALIMLASLASMIAMLAGRIDPAFSPGYASSRDIFFFRPPAPGSERRDG